jgi:SAM-dependent methyltransferase
MNPSEAWDIAAEAWDDFVESGKDYYRTEVHGPALLRACGDVQGLRVLDLGCGQGWFSRQLAHAGARVVGVELSENQLANARRQEEGNPLGIEYRLLDAAEIGSHFPGGGSFDLVTGCMSINDMEEASNALSGAYQVVRPGGRLVFSVPHPLTDPPVRGWERDDQGNKVALRVDRYFETGPWMVDWNMSRLKYGWRSPQWKRTFGEWSELLDDAGFVIKRIHEPRPTREQVDRIPELDDCYRLPYFLVFDCLKPPA